MSVRRILPLGALLAASAMVLTGCFLPFPQGPGGGTETVNTSTGEEVDPDLAPYYDQDLVWTDLGFGVDNAMVTVPLDWDDSTGETIEIAISRHRASGSSLGSMLYNPGGPGASGAEYVRDYAPYLVSPAILAQYDLIGFDPRGVGDSAPIECLDDPELDEVLYGTFDADYGTAAWEEEISADWKTWVDACVENTGDLLAHLAATNVARDMDVIRAVLGDEKLTYLGASYGTYLGTMYAALFPDKVGRLVLDGAVDPRVGMSLDALAYQMAGFESAYRSFLEYCFGESGCPFSGTVEQGLQQTRDLIGSIHGDGLTSSDGRVLDEATVTTGLFYYLYSQSAWPFLVGMLADLADGEAQSTFDAADGYNGRNPGGGFDDNSKDVYTAVICNESSIATDGVDTLAGLATIEEQAPYLGFYAALDDYAALEAACDNWPYPVAELPTDFSAPGAPPILVIGTTNDPATPYAQSVALAGLLSSGVLITYNGEGHTIYGQGVSCVDDAVDAFFLSGTVPSSDPNC